MIRLSASAVPRVLECTGSAVLPQHRYETKFAEEGTERHADMEGAVDDGDHEKLPAEVQALMRDGDKMATECAFAYDVATDTARELGHLKHRAYEGLAPFEVPGTVDLLIMGNGRAIVVDYKGFEEVDDAESNAQTATYALMVARKYGLSEITVVIVYLTGLRKPSIAILGAFDLDGHAARLKQLQFDVARAAADPGAHLVTGKQCKYCPAFLSCEKQSALTIDVSSADTVMAIESRIPFESDEDAADAFDLLQRIKMLTTRMSAALYARAAERPIPLRSGKMFGPVEKLGSEKLDGDIVYAVVKEKHGQGVADAAVVRSATKKRLKEALGFVGAKSVAAAERDVLEAVRAKGGAERKPKTSIEEYEPPLLRAVNE